MNADDLAPIPRAGERIVGRRGALDGGGHGSADARRIERAPLQRTLDAATIGAAAAAAVEGTTPADNALASSWYRREIVGVHLRRLLSGQE